jgi:hypothetical protein
VKHSEPAEEPWPGSVAPPDEAGKPAVRRPGRARNYLARSEERRIFWRFMPPAVVVMLLAGWLERAWFAEPRPPVRPQVDTRLPAVAPDPLAADAVQIEAAPAGLPVDAGDLGASPHALATVRDDTMFRAAEEEAWFQLWATLRSSDNRQLARSAAREVGFAELHGQPRSFRGKLVRLRGTLHRLEHVTAPPNQYDVRDYWQGWLEPEGGPASPIVVYFLRLPEGMPRGLKIDESVGVVGYFFKRWAYAATDAVRTAPVVLAIEPSWKPRPAPPRPSGLVGTLALVTMSGVVLLTMLWLWLSSRSTGRRTPAPPTDLESALADVELVDPKESLRRLEVVARGQDRAAP